MKSRKHVRHPRRRRWFRALAVALALLIGWAIPELIVRVSHPPLQAFTAIYFGGDPNTPRLFLKDPRLHWKLRPNVRVPFLGDIVATDRDGFRNPPAGETRQTLVCLGDSTTFGLLVPAADSFPRRLEPLLAGGPWRVINAGVPGYSSFQVRLQAAQWIPRWKPDTVVICIGNNEAWPVKKSDRQLDDQGRAARLLTSLLSHSRFLVWVAERIRPDEKPEPFIAKNLADTVPRVSLEEFQDNLARTIELARQYRARVIVLGPPVNLYRAPLRVDQFADWDPFMKYVKQFDALLEQQRFAEARQLVEQALAGEPTGFWHLWLRGKVLLAEDRGEAARAAFEEAFERHPYPERCKPSYRLALHRLAEQHGVAFLDVNDLFHRHTAPDPPVNLYLDWCHPTAEGHRLIATAIAGRLAQQPATGAVTTERR